MNIKELEELLTFIPGDFVWHINLLIKDYLDGLLRYKQLENKVLEMFDDKRWQEMMEVKFIHGILSPEHTRIEIKDIHGKYHYLNFKRWYLF